MLKSLMLRAGIKGATGILLGQFAMSFFSHLVEELIREHDEMTSEGNKSGKAKMASA